MKSIGRVAEMFAFLLSFVPWILFWLIALAVVWTLVAIQAVGRVMGGRRWGRRLS